MPRTPMRFAPVLAVLAACPAPLMAQEAIPADVQKAFELYLKLPDTLEPVLEKAKDRASADAVALEIHGILPQVYDTRSALQGIQSLPPQVEQAVRQRYEQPMRERWGCIYSHIFRLQKANCYGSPALAREFTLLCMMLNQ